MRKTIVTIAVLALLTLGYVAWPFYDLYRFVGAVDRGDVAAIMRAVDFAAVRQSLASQIVTAYLRRSGTRLNPLAQNAAMAVAVGRVPQLEAGVSIRGAGFGAPK